MYHAIVFNYFVFGTQLSDLLDMPQFHKISIAKRSHRKRPEKILGFLGTNEQNMLQYIASKNMPDSFNKQQAAWKESKS